MSVVYLAAADEDAAVLAPVLELLRRAGWDVQLSSGAHQRTSDPAIETARVVLVAWSRRAVLAPGVRADAERALELGRLVAARLDDAPHPLMGERATLDLSASAGPEQQARERDLLAALGEVAGAGPGWLVPRIVDPGDGRGHVKAQLTPQSTIRGLALVVAVLVACLIGWGAISALAGSGRGGDGVTPDSLIAGADAPAMRLGVSLTTTAMAAEAQWAATDRGDVLAVRAFLSEHDGAPQAAEARRVLAGLDLTAWARVAAAAGALETLRLLDAYRIDFPGGLQLAEGARVETEARNRIAEAQRLLAGIGLDAGVADGVAHPETLAAVTAFERTIGLPGDGRIDAALIEALTARQPLNPTMAEADASGVAPAVRAAAPGVPADATPSAPFRDCYICPELVALPAGRFEMGDTTGKGDRDERPVRTVSISYRLAVGRLEVTFDEWDACVTDGGCTYRPDDMGWGRGSRPVINVSAADVRPYLAWLSSRTGKRYRLLSEAEWEYAARAGSASDYAFGASPAELCRHGNGADAASAYAWRNQACRDGFGALTAPAGSFGANAFGLHDMIGNAWEWVGDCWHAGYAGAPVDGTMWARACDRPDQILRGGAFSVDPGKLRAAYRYGFANVRMPFFGFRVARVLEP